MMTCPYCKEESEFGPGQSCTHCGFEIAPPVTVEETILPEASGRTGVGEAYVVIGYDGTRSSLRHQDNIRRIVATALRHVGEQGMSVRVDVWRHGDVDFKENPELLLKGGTPEQAIKSIEAIKPNGGFDVAETHSANLLHMFAHSEWDGPQKRNIMLMVTTDETKKLRSERILVQLAEEMRKKRVRLLVVGQQLEGINEMVKTCGGILIDLSKDGDEKEIMAAAGRLCGTMTLALAGRELRALPATTEENEQPGTTNERGAR